MPTDDQAGRETAGARECDHMIGYRALGGMPGHEHSHPTGPQLCVKCGKTLDELLSEARAEGSRSREGADLAQLRATCAAQQERITALEQRASTAEGTLRDEVACTLEIYAALGIEWEVMVEGRAGQEAILRRILALREAEQRLQVSR